MNLRTRIAITRLRLSNFFNIKVKYWYLSSKYHLEHSAFKWTQDDDGDICFRLFWVFHFIKYKEHTCIKFGIKHMEDAGKYQGCRDR